jgi:hypothetical protein
VQGCLYIHLHVFKLAQCFLSCRHRLGLGSMASWETWARGQLSRTWEGSQQDGVEAEGEPVVLGLRPGAKKMRQCQRHEQVICARMIHECEREDGA